MSISHSNINVAASIPPSMPSGTTAVPATAATTPVTISTSVPAAAAPSGNARPQPSGPSGNVPRAPPPAGPPIFPKPSATTSSVQMSSERAMTTPPPPGPQTPSGSPMRVVVEREVPASPLPLQSAAHDDLMDFDAVGDESTWSAQANLGGCKSFLIVYILFYSFYSSSP